MATLSRLKYYLLVLLVFIFPLGALSRIDFGNGIAFTLNDAVVGLLAVLVAIGFLLGQRPKAKLIKPMLVFGFLLLLSLAVNLRELNKLELIVSSSYLFRLIIYSSIYVSVSQVAKDQKDKLLKLLTFSGFMVIVFGFLQLILYPDLKNLFYAGWDEHLYRIFSSFLDPNFTGIIFVLFFVLVLTRTKNFGKDKMFLLFLATIASVLTFSRTAVLSLLATIFSYGILLKREKLVFFILIVLFFGIGIFYVFVPKKESTNIFRTASTFARVENYKEAFIIFSKNPVFGVGYNSYRYALNRYGFKDKSKYGLSHGASGNDNSFLFILATSGILGFVALINLIFKSVTLKSLNPPLKYLTLLPILLGSFFVNALFYVFILEWLFIVLAATENT